MTAFFRRFSKLLFNEPHPRQDSAKGTGGSLVKLYDQNLKHPDALINRANKRVINGDLDGALSDFTAAISLNPSKATAYFNRGLLYDTLGKFEAAIDDFSESIALLPDYDEAFFHRGNSYRQLQDVQRAIQDYSQAIRLNPYCIKAYYKRAESRSELGFSPSALMDYSRVIVRVPKDPNAYYQRGLYLRKSGELVQAIEDFSVAIRLNPRLADAYFHRGYCQAELGKTDKAARDYSEAIRLNPNHQAAKEQALAVAALKESPGDASALPQKSPPIQPQVTQNTEAGSKDNSKLVAVNAQLSPVLAKLFDRANHRNQQGDLEGAIADYTQILAQDPQNSQAYFGRGRSLKATGDMKSAMVDIMQSIHWARVNSLGSMRDFNSELSTAVVALKQDLENLSYQRPVFPTKALKPAAPRPLLDQHSAALHQPSPTPKGDISAYPAQKTSALSNTIATPPPADSTTFSKEKQKLVAADITNPLDKAIAQLTHAIQANPLDADAFFRRGQSRALAGDLKGAIDDYSRSLRLDPHNREAYIHRAHCRSVLGDTAAAQEDLNHLIRHQPIPREQPSALPQPAQSRHQLPAAKPSEVTASPSDAKSSPSTSPSKLTTSSGPEAPSPQPVTHTSPEQSAAQLYPLESVDITQEMASLFQQENAILHASQISDQKVCMHSGNNPENKFCIHCGEPLIGPDQSDESAWEGTLQEPAKPIDSQRIQRLQEAEQYYSQGLALFRAGDRQGSLQALSAGLKIFLEQRAMQNYQKTLSLMQDVAHTLAKPDQETEESDNSLRL